MAKGQYGLAEQFGYVESMGGDGLKRGDLVPYDHPTSPLSTEDIETLMKARNAPGCIGSKETASKPKRKAKRQDREVVSSVPVRSAHRTQTCYKCGVQMRAGRWHDRHYAKCQGLPS